MIENPVSDRPAKPMSPAIRRVIAFILENYADTLPLSGLAQLAGLSLSRFMVVFREQTGLPPHQFICRVRVEAAQRMLERGQSPLSVAYDAGFFDQPSHPSFQAPLRRDAWPLYVGTARGGEPMSFRRLAETERRAVTFEVDGRAVEALEGDTYLTAIRIAGLALRRSEFGDGPRAGFCLMGACQDCWIWTEGGERLRACSTTAEAGARLLTAPDVGIWPCPIS